MTRTAKSTSQVALEESESEEMMADASSGQTLATKVNWLFEHVNNPATGKRFTLYAVRDHLRRQGVSVSANTIRNLRVGTVTHPSWYLVEGLACIFQTPLDFFSTHASIHELEEQFAALTLFKSSPFWALAQQASGLPPAGIAALLAITDVAVEEIQTLEARNEPSRRSK